MKKSQEITSFFYSQYFAEGLRITLGSIIPIIVCALLGEFVTGTLISLGALIIGLSDTPGAPRHRRSGMFYCTLLCVLTIIISSVANNSMIVMTVIIATLAFLLSMLSVFNARSSTIGLMCILVMLINTNNTYTFQEEMKYLAYFITGAGWYMLISFSLMQVKPYRIAQQEISETIIHIADYLRLKSKFYDPKVDPDGNYIQLIEKQIIVNEHQENVRDILFQSKRSIKDTTKEGRLLTLIFNDIIDIFEQSMTTQYDYDTIRKKYENTTILENIRTAIDKAAHELDNIAYKLNADKVAKPIYNFDKEIDKLKNALEEYDKITNQNSIAIKKIIINIRTIGKHINTIYNYSQSKIEEIVREEINQSKKFTKTYIINWQSFKDNFSLHSSVFRHALRMSIMLSLTYLVFNLIDYPSFGTYWILLTIMVILKPGFGLTKERNVQRLIGTIIGGIIGAIILMTIDDLAIRFGILMFFFLIAYSLFRINYIMAVIFMTPYVLIMLSFTGVNTYEMAKERVLDTFLGGTIAFLSSYIIFPNWESHQIKSNMRNLLIANYNYLAQAIQSLSGNPISIIDYKLARKEVYIASANMGSTFQRLLTEPKWRQNITKEVNKFVILNHIFSSYTATLLTQLSEAGVQDFNNEHLKLLYKTLANLEKSIIDIKENNALDFNTSIAIIDSKKPHLEEENQVIILEQLQFLNKISVDLYKIVQDFIQKDSVITK